MYFFFFLLLPYLAILLTKYIWKGRWVVVSHGSQSSKISSREEKRWRIDMEVKQRMSNLEGMREKCGR